MYLDDGHTQCFQNMIGKSYHFHLRSKERTEQGLHLHLTGLSLVNLFAQRMLMALVKRILVMIQIDAFCPLK